MDDSYTTSLVYLVIMVLVKPCLIYKAMKANNILRSPKTFTRFCAWVFRVIKDLYKLRCLPSPPPFSTFLGPNGTLFARSHFRAKKSLDFQGPPLSNAPRNGCCTPQNHYVPGHINNRYETLIVTINCAEYSLSNPIPKIGLKVPSHQIRLA